MHQQQQNEELFEEISGVKQKLFEKNCRIQFLEKQSLRDKAELDAKDKLIEREASKVEELQKKLEEAHEQNKYQEELLGGKAEEFQTMSIFVSKMLKEHFMDYESHSLTQPPIEQKLQILERHLAKINPKAKLGNKQTGAGSSLNANCSKQQDTTPKDRRQRPASAAKPPSVTNKQNSSSLNGGAASQAVQKPIAKEKT